MEKKKIVEKAHNTDVKPNTAPKLVAYEDDEAQSQEDSISENYLGKKRSITPENTPSTTKVAKILEAELAAMQNIPLPSPSQKLDIAHSSRSKTGERSHYQNKEDHSRARSNHRQGSKGSNRHK